MKQQIKSITRTIQHQIINKLIYKIFKTFKTSKTDSSLPKPTQILPPPNHSQTEAKLLHLLP